MLPSHVYGGARLAVALGCVLLLLGMGATACSRPASKSTRPAQEPTRQQAVFDASVGPTETVHAIYGSRLTSVLAEARGVYSIMRVRLASGEPTGTEPFKLLASLAEAYPGKADYQVTFYVPINSTEQFHVTGYVWRPAHADISMFSGVGTASNPMFTTRLAGFVSASNTATIEGIASSDTPLPPFTKSGIRYFVADKPDPGGAPITIHLGSHSGHRVKKFTPNRAGTFTIDLTPGVYTVIRDKDTTAVVVEPGEYATVEFPTPSRHP